jgi:hypothetical protein
MSGSSGSSSPEGVSRPSKPRRKRSVTESLLSIVLVLEAFVLFFASLTMFGLKVLEPVFPAWVALPAGGVAILLFLTTTAVLRHPWGIAIGWVLQAGLIALGILTPFMFVVGGGFALLWIYCFTRGRRIDRVRARADTNQGEPS